MTNNWKEMAFSEAVVVNPSVQMERGDEYPFVDMKAVEPSNRNVSESEIRVFKGGGSRFLPYDTLMARITPCLENGKIARYVPSRYDGPGHGSTEFIVIRGRNNITDNTFAYYLARWKEFKAFAVAQMTGTSGRQRVPVDSLNNFIVFVPPLAEQKAIAHILGSLDDKIELNRRMNETLESIARAIFKSWFVDFDPVKAKTEGRQPIGMDAETAQLFPDSFVDSELGPIPKDWEILRISEIGQIITGKTPPTRNSENYGDKIPFIRIPDMQKTVFVVNTEKYLSLRGVATQPEKELPPLSVCVSCIATPGLVAITCERSHTNQQINSIICNEQVNPYYVYLHLKKLGSHIVMLGSGGTATLNLNRGNFAKIELLVPGSRILSKFNAVVSLLFEQILLNAKECHSLTSIRDALLPKLLSGEIRVKDVDGVL